MGSFLTLGAVIPFWIALHIGFYKMFEKAGVPGWKGLIPIYCFWPMTKIIGKPWWWFALCLVPVVGMVMVLAMYVELSKSFKRDSLKDQALALLVPFAYFPYLGFKKTETYHGEPAVIFKDRKKSAMRDWGEAILFAIVAATIIRTFVIEPYTIPTGSMEKTLMVGDFLFASKVHYGTRVPMTPLHIPLVHHTIPVLGVKSYLDWIKLPYWRFPALQKVKRNDIIIFNFPEGDTVVKNASDRSYYQMVREYGRPYLERGGMVPMKDGGQEAAGKIIYRPVDKRDNYIKRCVAIPGDSIKIVNGEMFTKADGAAQWLESPNFKNKMGLRKIEIKDKMNPILAHLTEIGLSSRDLLGQKGSFYYVSSTQAELEKIKQLPWVQKVSTTTWAKQRGYDAERFFPNDPINYDFNLTNYGPIHIPKEGQKVKLTEFNLSLFRRIIETYEGNDFSVKDGKFYINGKETDEYEIEMDYYFVIGDNRPGSLDSRMFGYIPEDHILAKGWFIWLSLDNEKKGLKKVRWNRMFKPIHGKKISKAVVE